MARPKGSKNKTNDEKILDIIEEVKELDVSEEAKLEAIDELDDLLGGNMAEVDGKKFIGYHPITGLEIWI